jgi:hypothetical protein
MIVGGVKICSVSLGSCVYLYLVEACRR